MKKPIPLLIIISGPPCSGKTTLAEQLADRYSLPLVNKDGIKESLFDSLGWKDREWSKKLGQATYPLLYYFVESLLRAGKSHIVESNFAPEVATGEFLDLQKKYPFVPFQIQCRTQPEVLFERFRSRALSGLRHPGHVERGPFEEHRSALKDGRLEPLEIGGLLCELDTTDFEKIDYPALYRLLKQAVLGTELHSIAETIESL